MSLNWEEKVSLALPRGRVLLTDVKEVADSLLVTQYVGFILNSADRKLWIQGLHTCDSSTHRLNADRRRLDTNFGCAFI